MNKLKQLWSDLRGSFWFVPSLIVAGSLVVAFALIQLDSTGGQEWMSRWPRLFGSSASGARAVLSTIAGSMMTVVGVTFSMVLMTLTLASSQYTSRILRNFMRDRVTQVVLGIFAGIFIYCLIVLRTIRGGDSAGFIPSVSVTFAVVLAIGGIGALIFFIHHIAASIQASSIIASVAKETLTAIDRLFPQKIGHSPADDEEAQSPLPLAQANWKAVSAQSNGYIQSVDHVTLLRLAREHKTIIRMERGIGEFAVEGTLLASLALEGPPDKATISELHAAYSIDRHRKVEQDAAFGIRQIVDIALRALSPGINDTTTAVMSVDYLTAILARLASRNIPSSHRYEDGKLRVIAIGSTFHGLLAEAFDQIRESASGNLVIFLQILDGLQIIADMTDDPSRRRLLREQVDALAEAAKRTLASPHDQTQFKQRLRQMRTKLLSDH